MIWLILGILSGIALWNFLYFIIFARLIVNEMWKSIEKAMDSAYEKGVKDGIVKADTFAMRKNINAILGQTEEVTQ